MTTVAEFMSQVHSSSDFATPTMLQRQASESAANYLARAVREIDGVLGAGYAAKHPELVAAFMGVAAADLATAMIAKAIMYHGEQKERSDEQSRAD